MTVTQKQLDEIVADLVPEEYQPKGVNAFVTGISIKDCRTVERWAKQAVGSEGSNLVRALCINWGLLYKKYSLPSWRDSIHSHYIIIRDDLKGGMLEAAFAVLHEVGHVDWATRRQELAYLTDDKEELHADVYAYEILNKKFGIKAIDLLGQFASKDGFNSERYKGNV